MHEIEHNREMEIEMTAKIQVDSTVTATTDLLLGLSDGVDIPKGTT